MDIVRLIKISSQFPNTRLAKATRNYLLSLVEKEIDHNSRIAQLTDRVASTPSNYWQRAFSALKYATQGYDVSAYYLYLEVQSDKAIPFDVDRTNLNKLASNNSSVRLLVASVSEVKQQDRQQDRKSKNKKQKGKGKVEDAKLDRMLKIDKNQSIDTEEGQKIWMRKLNLVEKLLLKDDAKIDKTKLIKRVYGIIGRNQTTKTRLVAERGKWEARKKEPVKIKYKTLAGNPKTREVLIENLNSVGKSKNNSLISARKKKWEEEYGGFLKIVKQLALKAIKSMPSGQGSKGEEGSKGDGGESDTSKSDTSKSDTSKSDSGGEDKGIVESLMESEGISKEEAQEMAGNILEGEGEEEEETTEAPDSSESATGQSVSTSGGLGGLSGGSSSGESSGGSSSGYTKVDKKKSRKQKKYESKGGEGNWKDNKTSRKASEEEILFDIEF